MNSEKFRTIHLPRELIEELIASHLCAMKAMSHREIIELRVALWKDYEDIPIQIRMKELKSPKTSPAKSNDAKMAKGTQEEN